MPSSEMIAFPISSGGEVQLSASLEGLSAVYTGSPEHSIYLALRTGRGVTSSITGPSVSGSSIIPYAQGFEGSTVFLPFAADYLYCSSGDRRWKRTWAPMQWSDRSTECPEFKVVTNTAGQREFSLIWSSPVRQYSVAIYLKDLRDNDGWGSLVGCCDNSVSPGFGDKAIEIFVVASGTNGGKCELTVASRFHSPGRERIYELFVRLFGNTNPRRKRDGTLAENGCGKFRDITVAAVAHIAEMGFTHIWLMGVVRHATTTSYDLPGLSADETDLMKGLAGSPYAIKDYFDVAPDLASDPARRIEEFRALVDRIHAAGMKVLIDFVGNHVSRGYESQVQPDLNFGTTDDPSVFFKPENNFFYLSSTDNGGGPPLRLPTYDRDTGRAISPTCEVKQDCDGLFSGEMSTGRVTGNNSITWTPSINDWYETVKLNYGFDFTGRCTPQRCFPNAGAVNASFPDTWIKMDAVLAHWQQLGVDGFRCDMAHMVPPEFWGWSIGRARERNPEVFFMAEAYNDFFAVRTVAPEVLALGNQPLFPGLLHAGFNAVYGHDVYRVIKELYDGTKWANDIDGALGSDFTFSHSVHYAENHDEVRLASPYSWGGVGLKVGRAATAVLFGMGQGPVLFYNGQEVGEPAIEAEGFSGADGRTTLFDYWSMPELCKWSNGGTFDGGQLSEEQTELREYYARLISVCGQEVFHRGRFLSLNGSNIQNPRYGRLPGETASGHWLYAFLRYDRASKQRLLAVANFHESYQFTGAVIALSQEALRFLEVDNLTGFRLTDLLGKERMTIDVAAPGNEVALARISALTAYYFAIDSART